MLKYSILLASFLCVATASADRIRVTTYERDRDVTVVHHRCGNDTWTSRTVRTCDGRTVQATSYRTRGPLYRESGTTVRLSNGRTVSVERERNLNPYRGPVGRSWSVETYR